MSHQRSADRARRRRPFKPDGTHAVELAHQALIDHWPRLRSWLDEDRDFLLWQQQVDQQRAVWEGAGRDHGALLRGAALAGAEGWLSTRDSDVSAAQRALVHASRARRRREVRRRRGVLSGLTAVLVVALVLGSLFVYQRRVARQEEALSASRALAALSTDTAISDPVWSMMLALAAYQRSPTGEAENALFRHYLAYGNADTVLSGARGQIIGVDASDDGRVIAARTDGGIVTVWTRTRGREITMRHLQPGVQVATMDVAGDGSGILLVEPAKVWYYDVATGKRRWAIPVNGTDVVTAKVRDDGVTALRVATETAERLQLWEPAGGRHRLAHELAVPAGALSNVLGFGPDPGTVVVQDFNDRNVARVDVWDAPTGALRTIVPDTTSSAQVTSAGVVACRGGSLSLVNIRDGTERRRAPLTDTNCQVSADPGGKLAVVEGEAVDLRTGDVVRQPPLPGDPYLADAMVSDGDRHLSLSSDETRILLAEVHTDQRTVPDVQWAEVADGEHVVSVADEGRTVVVTSTRDGRILASEARPAPFRESGPSELAISPDGTLVADRVDADRVQLRRLPGLELLHELSTVPASIEDSDAVANLTVDRNRVLSTAGARAQWFDISTGDKVDELDLTGDGSVANAEWMRFAAHPDPTRVAVLEDGRPEVRILEIATGRQVDAIPVGDDVLAVQFQPDSPYFALLRRGRLIELWDATRRQRVLGPLRSVGDLTGQGFRAQFLPEPGQYFVGDNGRLRWYHPGSSAPERSLELGAGQAAVSLSPDGQVLLYRHEAPPNPTEVAHLQPAAWQDRICAVIKRRDFTGEERGSLPAGAGPQPLC